MPHYARASPKLKPCRASQRCYIRPQYTDPGRGECCRYNVSVAGWQQAPDRQSQTTVSNDEEITRPTSERNIASHPKPSPDAHRPDTPPDAGCYDSTAESSLYQDSNLTLSGSLATLATSICSSTPEVEEEPRLVTLRAMYRRDKQVLLRHDLEQCRQGLHKTVQSCNQAEYRQFCCAISCVLNSARPLSRPELGAAVKLNTLGRDWRSIMHDEQWTQLDSWIHRCSSIFVETLDGKIDFLHPMATRIFLRNRRIPGVDISHRTFGMISRNHIELHRFLASSSIARSDLVQAVHTLSSYVEEFGNHHLRAASLTSIIEVEGNDSRDDVSDGFEMISQATNQLSLVGEDGDWIVVKQTRV